MVAWDTAKRIEIAAAYTAIFNTLKRDARMEKVKAVYSQYADFLREYPNGFRGRRTAAENSGRAGRPRGESGGGGGGSARGARAGRAEAAASAIVVECNILVLRKITAQKASGDAVKVDRRGRENEREKRERCL